MTTAGEAIFRKVRAGNAFEETVERLLQAIRLGVVGVGQQLPPERELAARLGVSRVTLREAIAALQEAGFVESRRGRYGGTFVRTELPGPDAMPAAVRLAGDIDDALTLRAVLEVGAAEQAALAALTDEDRAHLRDCLAETAAAQLAEYRLKDSRLHLALAEVTGSPSLTAAVADARMRINVLLDAIPLLPRNIEHSNQQHEAIVDAVLAGDHRLARRRMNQHLAGTAALLHGFLA